MERVRVIPAEGRLVYDPETRRHLPPEGAEVELGTYWIRRADDGDVSIEAQQPSTRGKRRAAAEE